MDDRFDFVLASRQIIDDSLNIKYIPSSYRAVGQDGKRFNGSVNSPTNTDVPGSIADNLYNLSDHLPVILKLEVTYEVPTNVYTVLERIKFNLVNPSQNGIQFNSNNSEVENQLKYEVFSLDGSLIKSGNLNINQGYQGHQIDITEKGIFILKMTVSNSNESDIQKVLVW